MTAAMDCLANTHGITLAFMKSLGGKEALLQEFPTIKEQVAEFPLINLLIQRGG